MCCSHSPLPQEAEKPSWDDGEPAGAAQDDSWDNSFGGLGADIVLEKAPERQRTEPASELLVIDFAAPKNLPPDPAEELRKARAEQAAKTAAAWKQVRATYNRRAPK